MKVDVYELFPTVVMSFNLGRELTTAEDDIIQREMKNVGKNAGNWTGKEDQFLNIQGTELIGAQIMKCANIYFDHVFHSKNTPELYFAQSWLNLTYQDE